MAEVIAVLNLCLYPACNEERVFTNVSQHRAHLEDVMSVEELMEAIDKEKSFFDGGLTYIEKLDYHFKDLEKAVFTGLRMVRDSIVEYHQILI